MYTIQPRSAESVRQEDEEEGAEKTKTATGGGMCVTEQEAVAVEEIDKEEEEEESSVERAQEANEEDTDEYYFEDPSNIGNYMQHTQQNMTCIIHTPKEYSCSPNHKALLLQCLVAMPFQ